MKKIFNLFILPFLISAFCLNAFSQGDFDDEDIFVFEKKNEEEKDISSDLFDLNIDDDVPVKKEKSEKKTYTQNKKGDFEIISKFNRIQDYRSWSLDNSRGKIIPEHGKGLNIPADGKPAVAVFDRRINVHELQFRAKIIDGDHINWYINTEWDGSWRPKRGIGGIMRKDGCMLTINGKIKRIPNSPRSDKREHFIQVQIENDILIWGIDGRVVIKTKIPRQLAEAKGNLAIGAYRSNINVDSVYIGGSE